MSTPYESRQYSPGIAFGLGYETRSDQGPVLADTTLSFDGLRQPRAIGVDTSKGPVTLTLPAVESHVPYLGLEYLIYDAAPAGSFGINPVTLDGNGKNIHNAATYTVGTSFATLRVRYNGSFYNVFLSA